MDRFRTNQKSVNIISTVTHLTPGYSLSLIQYSLGTYFVSISALDAGDFELGKTVSFPSEMLQFRRRARRVST